MRRLGCLVAVMGALFTGGSARAETAPAPPAADAAPPASAPKRKPRSPWQAFRTGAQLVHSIPVAAVLDGIWSLSLQTATQMVNRTWAPPFPWGTIGHYSTHLLYGTTWTLMLGTESLIVVMARGIDWIGDAVYRIDWMLGYDLPACPRPGAMGGCGVGAGDFAFLQVRPNGSRWWWEAGGGWFQQRVANDELRTLGESTWVLTPISVLREFSTDREAPVALRTFIGPGLYGGMHNANLHPTQRGHEVYSPPWTELYPLDIGAGPGARAEARLTFFQQVSLEAELTFAPFLLGGPVRKQSREIAPLDFERQGMSVWRKLTAGVAWFDPHVLPFKTTLAFYAAELSDRPVGLMGYRGAMLRFDVPLKVPNE
ncbi:MAG: hypothetical protein KIT84_39905 [Labilithrix sp.]|nr:hypothetical protein [Labilithrix sp.]MCW5817230.1 hypothetical protein [Labilithrix sp.]